MKFYIKRFTGVLFARTKKELDSDYDMDCAKTVGIIEVKDGCKGIYASTMEAHWEILAERAIEAYKNGKTSIQD